MKYRRAKRKEIIKKNEFYLVGFEWNGDVPRPGQFFMLSAEKLIPFLPRPFSVFDFRDQTLYFLVKTVGIFTEILPELEEINILGPMGNPAPVIESTIFVGGGIGIAPLHYHAKKTEGFTFISGSKGNELKFFLKDIEEMGTVIHISEDGSTGLKGFATDPLMEIMEEASFRAIVACGPEPMLKKVKEITGKKQTYLYMEQYMACGYGSCKGCAIKTTEGYKLVCKDGPVFPAEEVIFD